MHARWWKVLSSVGSDRGKAVVGIGLVLPLVLGCLGLGLQLGPLGIHLGCGEAVEEPKPPPPPPPKKELVLIEEPDGTLRQEGEISVPPRCCASVYYLRQFACTPHLEVSEPDVDRVHFVITEQGPDHFTIKNTSLLLERSLVWRARGANPATPQAPRASPPPPSLFWSK